MIIGPNIHERPPFPFSLAGQADPHYNIDSQRGLLSSSITCKIHETECNVVRRRFWYMPTWMSSNLFPCLRSLLCTFAVTGWQTVQLEITARTIRLWQASVALYLTVVLWGMVKREKLKPQSNFTPPHPVNYLHDTELQLHYWCFVVAACWGWRQCWGEEEGNSGPFRSTGEQYAVKISHLLRVWFMISPAKINA